MSRDAHRVTAAAIASVVLILAATLVLDWFAIALNGVGSVATITFDLREARACTSIGACGVVPMTMIKGGMYPNLALVTFWGSLAFAGLLAYRA
ncbi:MAG TPA: hypothetical protein VK427_04755, partial [Kofleriaceae bacterium]|nr:hypothetical protein [Kofleriaceae bacterium]